MTDYAIDLAVRKIDGSIQPFSAGFTF